MTTYDVRLATTYVSAQVALSQSQGRVLPVQFNEDGRHVFLGQARDFKLVDGELICTVDINQEAYDSLHREFQEGCQLWAGGFKIVGAV